MTTATISHLSSADVAKATAPPTACFGDLFRRPGGENPDTQDPSGSTRPEPSFKAPSYFVSGRWEALQAYLGALPALHFVGASGPLYKTISDALEDASCRLTGRSPLKPGDVVALPEAAVSLTLGWLLATEQVPHASTLLPLAQHALQTFWRASEYQPGSAPKRTANGASVEGSQIAREYAKQADALLEQCGLSASQPQTFASEVSFHPPATSPGILPPPDLRPLSTVTGPASVSPTAVPPTAVPPESDPEVYKSSAATSPDTVLEKIASTLEMCSGTMRMFEEFMKQMMGGQGPVACRQGEGTDDVSARPISEGCARRDVKEAWFDHWRPSAPNSPTLPGSEAAPSIRAN